MADKTRGSKIKYRFLKNGAALPPHCWLWRCCSAASAIGISCLCRRRSIGSVPSHLSEILRKSDNMLNHLVSRNQMILHLWAVCWKTPRAKNRSVPV